MLKQTTIDGDLVPIAHHPEDTMDCSDNTYIRRGDAFIDCRDNAHRTEEERCEADREYVEEVLDDHAKWAFEYVQSEDYGDGYSHLAKECQHDWNESIKDWVIDDGIGEIDWTAYPELLKVLVESISQRVYDCDNWGQEYDSSDYSSYYGSGCCLCSIEVGEFGDQISLTDVEGFADLHDKGELEGHLEDYNGDLYISRNDHYDKELACRVPDGYVSKWGSILGYTNPGGQWHFVVSSESMEEELQEAINDYADGDCYGDVE